ncbi:putative disease resistance protein [Sesamum angolense]|uniref:Disease resistance protein n=1 Tax=Sesamum angolense TaxID=2727404 RepID=A0AAE1XBR5_9LAMI|nr:putative disease resistance protein [Sesamum angolense]
MAAYAALLSLFQTLDNFPRPLQQTTSHLHDKLCCFLLILEEYSRNSSSINHLDLEGQIRDASHEAQDIIESHISTQLHCKSGLFWKMISGLQDMFLSALYPRQTFDYTHQDLDLDFRGCLDKVIDEFDSILEALSKIKDGREEEEASRTRNSSIASSSTLVAGIKSEPVGLHQDLDYDVKLMFTSLGRRYLVVMDDVWDSKVWDDVKRFFQMTTMARWDLLRKTVFGEKDCPSTLETIGHKIAHNCKGLPLAIVVIGGLLSKDSTVQKDWECIAEDVKTAATNGGDLFMEILSLSYNSLPHHLKACFLYTGVFPEDYEIFVTQLIKLWIAEGFVKPPTPKSFEQVAEDYLKDLVDRCLIQVQRRTYTGEIKTCTIHDMLRELCMKKAQDEKLYRIMNRHSRVFPQGRSDQRRFSIHGEPVVKDSVVLENLQTLTGVIDLRCTKEVCAIIPNLKKLGVSYISYIDDSQDKWSSYEFDNFVYLHQLETLKCRFITKDPLATKFLPVNLAFPPNLKKLTLSGFRIPWEKMTVVGTLPNLQVLKLRDHAFEGSTWEPNEGEYSKLKFLLIDVSNLVHWRVNDTHFPQLQHLRLSRCFSLEEIPLEIGEIQKLEMLELYECSPSVEASVMLIQEEQENMENYGLSVHIKSYSFDNDNASSSLRKATDDDGSRRRRLSAKVERMTSNNFQISEPYVLGKIIEVHCGRIWSLVTSIVI